MRTPIAILACVLLAALGACRGDRSASHADMRIAASIPPLAWVAQGLAPEGASVTTLLPPGASEHGYEPPPSRLAAFVRADVVLLVGLGLDGPAQRAIENTRRRDRAVVVFANATDLSAGRAGSGHDHVDHSDHAHAHPNDPHLWLDPARMADLVRAAHDALAARASPEELPALAARRDALLREVKRVDAACRERLAPYRGGVIVATHDSARRFADRYGLRVAGAIHAHEGSEPAPGEIVAAARALRDAPYRAILVEPQSGRALAERLSRETGAPIAQFDSLGRGDWPATMLTNLDALERAFAASAPTPAGR